MSFLNHYVLIDLFNEITIQKNNNNEIDKKLKSLVVAGNESAHAFNYAFQHIDRVIICNNFYSYRLFKHHNFDISLDEIWDSMRAMTWKNSKNILFYCDSSDTTPHIKESLPLLAENKVLERLEFLDHLSDEDFFQIINNIKIPILKQLVIYANDYKRYLNNIKFNVNELTYCLNDYPEMITFFNHMNIPGLTSIIFDFGYAVDLYEIGYIDNVKRDFIDVKKITLTEVSFKGGNSRDEFTIDKLIGLMNNYKNHFPNLEEVAFNFRYFNTNNDEYKSIEQVFKDKLSFYKDDLNAKFTIDYIYRKKITADPASITDIFSEFVFESEERNVRNYNKIIEINSKIKLIMKIKHFYKS